MKWREIWRDAWLREEEKKNWTINIMVLVCWNKKKKSKLHISYRSRYAFYKDELSRRYIVVTDPRPAVSTC